MVAILKKKLGIKRNIYEILQILSRSLFDKTPLLELFCSGEIQPLIECPDNVASLFDI